MVNVWAFVGMMKKGSLSEMIVGACLLAAEL